MQRKYLVLALAAVLPLAACVDRQPDPKPADTAAVPPSTFIGSKVQAAMEKAKAELETKNLSISDGMDVNVGGFKLKRDDNLPRAEITPQGDLLIEGAKVATTPEQQALLKQYRSNLIEVAKAGMDIGAQGADLGVKAATEALKGIFNGADEKEIEQRVEAQASSIKAAAKQLCLRLPALMDSQQKLAAALPEFKPYATMTQSDIDDCEDDIDNETTTALSDAERSQLQQDIRGAIREGVRSGGDAAAQAVADAAEKQASDGSRQ